MNKNSADTLNPEPARLRTVNKAGLCMRGSNPPPSAKRFSRRRTPHRSQTSPHPAGRPVEPCHATIFRTCQAGFAFSAEAAAEVQSLHSKADAA